MSEGARSTLEVIGAGSVVAGVCCIWWPLGLIALGVALLLISWKAGVRK